jgi:hypothetical protein
MVIGCSFRLSVAVRPDLRGSALEEFLPHDDDGNGRSGGDAEVLQQVNQEDHGRVSL